MKKNFIYNIFLCLEDCAYNEIVKKKRERENRYLLVEKTPFILFFNILRIMHI